MTRLRPLAPVAGMLPPRAGTALAAPPERFGPEVEQFSDVVDCGDFDASITGTVTTRYTVFMATEAT